MIRHTQPPPGVKFNKPTRADFPGQIPYRIACATELRRAWKEYDQKMEGDGLSCVQVIIPTRSKQMLESWAAEECATFKEERDNGQEPSIQYPSDDILMSDYVSDIPDSHAN